MAQTFTDFVGEDTVTDGPPMSFSGNQEAERREFARAVESLAQATNEELLVAAQPTEGTSRPHPIWGERFPLVRVRWTAPPLLARPQNVRAAAFLHLLRRNNGEVGPKANPYVLAVMARSPDVARYLLCVAPEQLSVCVDGKPTTGKQKAFALLLPYGHLDSLEQAGISVRLGRMTVHSISQTAQRIWRCLVQRPFCDVAEQLIAGGIRGKVYEEEVLMEIGDRAFHRLVDVQSRLTRSRTFGIPPSNEEIEGAVRDGLYFLFSASMSAVPNRPVLPPQVVNDSAPPYHCRRMVVLMAKLLSPAGCKAVRGFFVRRNFQWLLVQMEQRETMDNTSNAVWLCRKGSGALLERIYRGFIGRVVWVLDMSGGARHSYELTMRLVRDLQRWARQHQDSANKGADLREWLIIALGGSELYVFSPTQRVRPEVGAGSPLYPALEYAKSLRPDVLIVHTGWTHNVDVACVRTHDNNGWSRGQKIVASAPPDPPWARYVLTLDELSGECPIAGQENVVNVRIPVYDEEKYCLFLSTVACFARSLTLDAEVTVKSDRDRPAMTVRIK